MTLAQSFHLTLVSSAGYFESDFTAPAVPGAGLLDLQNHIQATVDGEDITDSSMVPFTIVNDWIAP